MLLEKQRLFIKKDVCGRVFCPICFIPSASPRCVGRHKLNAPKGAEEILMDQQRIEFFVTVLVEIAPLSPRVSRLAGAAISVEYYQSAHGLAALRDASAAFDHEAALPPSWSPVERAAGDAARGLLAVLAPEGDGERSGRVADACRAAVMEFLG